MAYPRYFRLQSSFVDAFSVQSVMEKILFKIAMMFVNDYITDCNLFNNKNINIEIIQAHGDCDPVVPYKWGQLTSQLLREILPNHEFKSYKVLHFMTNIHVFMTKCVTGYDAFQQ